MSKSKKRDKRSKRCRFKAGDVITCMNDDKALIVKVCSGSSIEDIDLCSMYKNLYTAEMDHIERLMGTTLTIINKDGQYVEITPFEVKSIDCLVR